MKVKDLSGGKCGPSATGGTGSLNMRGAGISGGRWQMREAAEEIQRLGMSWNRDEISYQRRVIRRRASILSSGSSKQGTLVFCESIWGAMAWNVGVDNP